jgi:uncharacterized phage infection (PIP) family protein YhgE
MSDFVKVHIDSKKIKKFINGGSIKVFPGKKIMGGIPVKVAFNARQHYKNFTNKLNSGGAMVLKPEQLESIEQVEDSDDEPEPEQDDQSVEGGNIIKQMKKQYRKAIKETKAVTDQVADKLKGVEGGAIKNKQINKGLKQAAKVTQKALKQVTKVLGKEGKQIVKNNKGALKDLAKDVIKAGLDNANGEGDFDNFKEVTKKAANNTKHIVMKESLARNKIMNEDDYRYGQFKNPEIQEKVEMGAGFGRRANPFISGGFDVNNTMMNPKIYRRTQGGSFKKLGGSVLQL